MKKIILIILVVTLTGGLSGCGVTLYGQAESYCQLFIGKDYKLAYAGLNKSHLICENGIATICVPYAHKMSFGGRSKGYSKNSYICLKSDKNGTIREVYDAGFNPPELNYNDKSYICPDDEENVK
ncbi:lipoprotein [Maridesulfovibrio ferrireducens]|uniref:LptM family lipoprotein n=1 Tax=Maridesulfovibrio ferrireducens TaxID=246191 RepID=UPI001A2140E9|nr:hypothetical protein [Maridesulfovibrio ferrireducens]MBI9110294.1 hypothetical protein [Maridesulfovibrio ferrireducens]